MPCLVSFTLLALALTKWGVNAGCTSDADCNNNFDCVRLGVFRGSACIPKSCAVRAVQAMIDEGFDPQKWVDDIATKASLGGRGFWWGMSNEDATALSRAYETVTPPPTDVFTRSFQACTNPKSDADRAQILRSTLQWHGLQWSVGAGCVYTGKSFWIPLLEGNKMQMLQHCYGWFFGAQLSAASYVVRFQTLQVDLEDSDTWPDLYIPSPARQQPEPYKNDCIPIAMVGPLQVTVCGTCGTPAVEVSIGGQLGLGLGGAYYCWFHENWPYDLGSFPTPSPTTHDIFGIDPFEVSCEYATTVDIGDSVIDSNFGRTVFPSRECGNASSTFESAGNFYQVIGNGKTITVDTCFPESDTGSSWQISVWSGTCSSLTCVYGGNGGGTALTPGAGNIQASNYCSLDSPRKYAKVSWGSTLDTVYYVYAHNRYNRRTGTYRMTVTSSDFESSCSAATTVNIGDTLTDSTFGRKVFPSQGCGFAVAIGFSAGYFYKVVGDGQTITVDTCFNESNFDVQISVWSGTCSSLTCVAGGNDQGSSSCSLGGFNAKVSWASTLGTDYFFYVHNRESSTSQATSITYHGTFKMSVTSA